MEPISDQQRKCLNIVKEVLGKIGASGSESFEGIEEKYFLMKVGKVRIYLYADGEANIQVDGNEGKIDKDLRYELADFDGAHDRLLRALKQDLQELLAY